MATLVGHASWAEKTLIECGRFYPADVKTPEARLRFYASVFPLVEVDSSHYAIPTQSMAQQWAERTPPEFKMNVKAFRFFTGHLTDTSVLGAAVRGLVGSSRRILYRDAAPEVRNALWQQFTAALDPLRAAGKLGLIHFQFPPSVVPSPKVTAHLEQCMKRLPRDTLSVEFRHQAWWADPRRTTETLAMLRGLNLVHTIVDGPQGAGNSVPAVWEATHRDYALLRLHGRNAETYNATVATAAERFSYEYSDAELRGLVAEFVRVSYKVRNAHMIFNNCDEDRGIRNGISAMKMLQAHGDRPQYGEWAPNGMLGSMSVEEVRLASDQLPPAAADQPAYREVEVDLERFGRVVIAFKLKTARHHKSSHMFWMACFARPI